MKKCYLVDYERKSVIAQSQYVGYQISLHNIPDVWLETQGEDIVVAVLDTGCQLDHIDLSERLIPGHNTDSNSDDVTDRDFHGTHVSGIICANNNELGIVGVAPKAKVLVIKVLNDDGEGSFEGVAAGIDFAVNAGADVISMSLGAPFDEQILHEAVQRAYAANIPVICAAGNSGDVGFLDYPARYPETISIGALDDQNLRADFSQTGEILDFMAPGVDILSTVPANDYMVMSGTSMATPWAAGVVALMIAKHRKYGGNTPVSTVEDVREHLRKTAIDLQQAGRDRFTGFGLVDVVATIEQIQNVDQGESNVELDQLNTLFSEWLASYRQLIEQEQSLTEQLQQIQAQKEQFTQKAQSIQQILTS